MKTVLKIFLWVVAGLLAIVLIGALFLPSETKLERTIVIDSKPATIYKQVACLKNWDPWSPFKEGISDMKYSGAECGEGAIQTWADKNMSGKQAITKALENEYLKTELDFQQGDVSLSEWKFEAQGEQTKVTWTFSSKAGYPLGRWINYTLVLPMLTESYEKGLSALKNYTESLKPEQDLSELYKTETLSGSPMLFIRKTVKMNDISKTFEEFYGAIMGFMKKNKLEITGAPLAFYHSWSETETDMECAIPFKGKTKGNKQIKVGTTYIGKAITYIHSGSYSNLQNSWTQVIDYTKKQGLELNGSAYEEYITDPTTEPDTSKWITKLYQPIK